MLSFHDIILQKGVCLPFAHQSIAIFYLTLSLTFASLAIYRKFCYRHVYSEESKGFKLIRIIDTMPECIVFLISNNDC